MKKLLIVVACIIYVVWPIDVLPDFIPIVGWIDDLVAIVTAALMCFGGAFSGPASPGAGSGGAA
jgi:uncharacterized membrane protein YkvA (DUF1232 family)